MPNYPQKIAHQSSITLDFSHTIYLLTTKHLAKRTDLSDKFSHHLCRDRDHQPISQFPTVSSYQPPPPRHFQLLLLLKLQLVTNQLPPS